MNDKLPVDYRDYPTAYVGQPRRFPSEEYSDFDRANPDAPSGRKDANDALDPDRPSGASTTPIGEGRIIVVMPASTNPVPEIKKPKIVWRARNI